MTGEVRVPRMRVHQVRPVAVVSDSKIDAHGLEGTVGIGQLRQIRVCGGSRLVALRTETPDLDIDIVEASQRSDELGCVHSGATVDGRRVFLGEEVDSHGLRLVACASICRDAARTSRFGP